MKTPTRRAPLPGLTALRFFAATYVLFAHLVPLRIEILPKIPWGFRLLTAGITAVSCFFILSGFILAYAHEQVPDLRRFFRARFARIYPLYLFAILISLPVFFKFLPQQHSAHNPLWAIPLDLLLLQDWFPAYRQSIQSPAWTLSCEAFFYLTFPFAVAVLRRHLRHAPLWLLGCGLFQLIPPLLNGYWLAAHRPAWSPVVSDVLSMPLGHYGEFLAGVTLGLLFLRRTQTPNPARPPDVLWLPFAGIAVCLLALSLNGLVPAELMRNGVMLGPYSLLIWALAVSPPRILGSRLLQLGGEISYGVYLLQNPFAHLLFLLRRLTHGFVDNVWWFAALYPAAWLTYLVIEKPCRALLMARLPSRADKPIPTPQPELP